MTYIACPRFTPASVVINKFGRQWYHENINFKDTLVITAGDSWTWGDSLGNIDAGKGIHDSPARLTSIYGHLLSVKMDADFINIGNCGGSNLMIHNLTTRVLGSLEVQYKNIYVFFTLTENCRESNWSNAFNHAVTDNLTDFLIEYERLQFELYRRDFINRYPHMKFFIGRNFTYSFDNNKSILGDNHLDKTWVDCLAEYQNKLDYPRDLRMLSGLSYDSLQEHLKETGLFDKFKYEFIKYFDEAQLAIKWLMASDLNYKKATKHPTELGHQLWADYLHSQITK